MHLVIWMMFSAQVTWTGIFDRGVWRELWGPQSVHTVGEIFFLGEVKIWDFAQVK